MNKASKKAFTLAEVLITLGIIGVIATMSMPTLIANYQKKVYVTGLHKVYNELSQAVEQVMTDNNAETLEEAGLTSQTAVNDWMNTYLKITRDCGSDSSKCFAPKSEYSKLNKASSNNFIFEDQHYYALASGSAICIMSAGNSGNNAQLAVLVDTNGKKKPNILGRDSFVFVIYNNGIIDDYYSSEKTAPLSNSDRIEMFDSQCNKNDNDDAWGCFGKILSDGWQMNY